MYTTRSHAVLLFASIALAGVSESSSNAQRWFGTAAAPTAAQKAGQKAADAAPPSAKPPPSGQASEAIKLNVQPGPGWSSTCTSASRQAAVECSVEQTVVVASSRQLLASVVIRVPADTRKPVMMIEVPLGLYLPAGLTVQVDDDKPQSLALQTCDSKGCYTGTPVSAEMISAMKGGKVFKITLQNMAKENISVPLALDNFADAYQKIE